jgi:hypothetical protein
VSCRLFTCFLNMPPLDSVPSVSSAAGVIFARKPLQYIDLVK